MNTAFLEIFLILVLLIANGVFAMTEIAIVSSRKGLLQSMADKGSKGASRALALSENPNRVLWVAEPWQRDWPRFWWLFR